MEIKKCLACSVELGRYKRFYCSDKCQIAYLAFKRGKKKKEEMFENLAGKRKYSVKGKEIKEKKYTWRRYRYYINR